MEGDQIVLPDYFVGVQPEYLITRSGEGTAAEGVQVKEADCRDQPKEPKGKKRARDEKYAPEDRLCLQIQRGNICPFGNQCHYSHDVLKYLADKEPDVGPECYQYKTFGYCTSGLMCRFGDCHIDRTAGTNLKRPDSEGGVVEREAINVLPKDLQNMLRKKKYRTPAERASDAASTTGAPSTEAIAPPTGAEEELKVVSEGATGVTAPAHTTPASPSSVGFNTSPYPTAAVKLVDFSRKVYVAPLTTIGNLPYRRILKEFGADITCGEMAMAQNIQSGQSSEWALLRRHSSEDLFGVQLAGGHADYMGRTAKIIENETQTDFIDLNCGCPIDVICSKGAGSALMNRPKKLIDVVSSLTRTLKKTSVTVKIRTGWDHNNPTGHKLIPEIQKVSRGKISAIMMHGRSRLQRYTGPANWEYILRAARAQDTSLPTIPIIGNGDIFSYDDWKGHQQMLQDNMTGDEIGLCDCAMIGRGAIIKPWLPTEVKESRHWDISASERMDMYKRFVSYGMEHWGSDQQGINTTRRFLLEWLSFTHRYVPMGIIEHDRLPQRISQKPPLYRGRGDLETLLSSPHSDDWIEIARILLGPLPDGFRFTPKHKSNSYAAPVATQVVESAASEVSNDWN